MNKKSIKVIVVLMLAVFAFSVSGCSSTEATQSVDSESSTSQTETAQSDANQADTTDTAEATETDLTEEDDGLSEISTEFGTLYFPSEWIDDVLTQEEDGDSSCSVTFSAEIDGARYELFTVSIDENEENSVGTLTDADGNARAVSIEAYDLGDLSALSEEEQDQLYAMQEALNVVVENLK